MLGTQDFGDNPDVPRYGEGFVLFPASVESVGLFVGRASLEDKFDPPYCLKQEYRVIVRKTDEVLASVPSGTCLKDNATTFLIAE